MQSRIASHTPDRLLVSKRGYWLRIPRAIVDQQMVSVAIGELSFGDLRALTVGVPHRSLWRCRRVSHPLKKSHSWKCAPSLWTRRSLNVRAYKKYIYSAATIVVRNSVSKPKLL